MSPRKATAVRNKVFQNPSSYKEGLNNSVSASFADAAANIAVCAADPTSMTKAENVSSAGIRPRQSKDMELHYEATPNSEEKTSSTALREADPATAAVSGETATSLAAPAQSLVGPPSSHGGGSALSNSTIFGAEPLSPMIAHNTGIAAHYTKLLDHLWSLPRAKAAVNAARSHIHSYPHLRTILSRFLAPEVSLTTSGFNVQGVPSSSSEGMMASTSPLSGFLVPPLEKRYGKALVSTTLPPISASLPPIVSIQERWLTAADPMQLSPDQFSNSIAPSVANTPSNVVVEGNSDALRNLFEGSPDAIADMANLRPCPNAAIAALKVAGLKTDLKLHQSTGLKFLVDSEHRKLPASVSEEEVCLWKVIDEQRGVRTFANVATREYQQDIPKLPRGAILADTMGLGKTLVILALILTPPSGAGIVDASSRDESSNGRKDVSSKADSNRKVVKGPTFAAASRCGAQTHTTGSSKKGVPSSGKRKAMSDRPFGKKAKKANKIIFVDSDSDMDDVIWSSAESSDTEDKGDESGTEQHSSDAEYSSRGSLKVRRQDAASDKRPTLVVCPLSVLSNWIDQAKQHTNLRFGVLYGKAGKRLQKERDWCKYDFIVTTYDVIKLAYREIGVFKYHEQRQAAYLQERRNLEAQINEQQGNMDRRLRSAEWCWAAIASLRAQLVELDKFWAKTRLITPLPGGETQWRNEQRCLDRLEAISQRGFNGAVDCRLTSWKQPRLTEFLVSDDDSEEEHQDWSHLCRTQGKGKQQRCAKRFEDFTEDERLYVWTNLRKKPGATRVFEQEWLRVVLDEAHVARNHKTNIFGSISELKAQRKHAVTGTPLINSTQDLGSLVSFIGVEPFAETLKLWTVLIEIPIKNNVASGMKLLRSICKSLICLRTKEMKIDGKPLVDLPLVQNLKYELQLKPHDREFYNRAEEALRRKIKFWIAEHQMAEYASSILMFLTRMRQLASDKRLVPSTLIEDIEMTDVTDEERTKMPSALRDLLQNYVLNGESCPLCTEALTWESKPVILRDCGHYAHEPCLEVALEDGRRCPLCDRAIRKDESWIQLPEQQGEEVDDSGLGDSAKIDALVEIVDTIYRSDPREKVLVFSNFVGFLKLIEKRMQAEGVSYETFYGAHSRAQREGTLKSFRRPFPADGYYPPLLPKSEKVNTEVKSGVIKANFASADLVGRTLLEQLEASNFKPKDRNPVLEIPRVLLMSIGAGSVGLNLTVANHVIIADPWWQGAIELQAQDRCHRIGQTKEVKVYRLVTSNTVEERVTLLANEKLKLAAAALDGVQYKGKALWEQKQSQHARLKDIAHVFGISSASDKHDSEIRNQGISTNSYDDAQDSEAERSNTTSKEQNNAIHNRCKPIEPLIIPDDEDD